MPVLVGGSPGDLRAQRRQARREAKICAGCEAAYFGNNTLHADGCAETEKLVPAYTFRSLVKPAVLPQPLKGRIGA